MRLQMCCECEVSKHTERDANSAKKGTDRAAEESSQTENNESRPRLSPGKAWFLRGGDLPSQLLHELRVVRREELHHKTKDGVFRP